MTRTARPPIIAVMGHIDHGKSSLLDYIRKTNVVAGEAGGITQHVSAYRALHDGRSITFLDTPGHEAFEALRERGAQAADIAILVVAADEGVMPQTEGALAAIKEAGIPFLIAITKIDKNNADIERAKTSLLEHGIFLEGMGGDVAYVPVSSKTGEGITELLNLVLLAQIVHQGVKHLLDLGEVRPLIAKHAGEPNDILALHISRIIRNYYSAGLIDSLRIFPVPVRHQGLHQLRQHPNPNHVDALVLGVPAQRDMVPFLDAHLNELVVLACQS